MKKIININFQGRVIPIEETAYDILKQYVESLRGYFSNEEGSDEIINDIESRIAELFSNRLKRAATCITDEDVNAVIASIGRPQDLEEAEGAQAAAGTTAATGAAISAQPHYQHNHQTNAGSRRLFRSVNDKIIGGVAAGLGNYFGIDPSIMRLLFVLFFFMGFGILVYIILWIVVPARTLVTNVRKRLFRNPENRMIGGVAGGIAAYLNIDTWIPRIIFLLPFILGAFSKMFRNGFMDFDPLPHFLFNGFGGSLLIIYIVLWIVLPEATTATDKLEMRGEKVDLESIKKTVKEDLENFKGRADKMGGEIKERAQFYGQQVRTAGQNFAIETAPMVRRSGSGFAHAIGVLFKAFFLFAAGIIIFVLITGFAALMMSGVGAFPFKDFILEGFWQNFLAWSTLVLFLGVPIIALLTWLIRRIMGVKSRNHYIGYTFGSLWILGLISAVLLSGMIASNFRSKTSVNQDISVAQPATGKMYLKVTEKNVRYYGPDWFGFDDNLPFFTKNEDSIMMNTVRLNLTRSSDSFFHVSAVKFSNGNSPVIAENLASRINFPVSQVDSVLYLPKGFTITQRDKFRNQQVMLIVEIPVGKRIEVDKNVDSYTWFNINMNRRRGINIGWDERWDNDYNWQSNTEYIMTPERLEPVEKYEKENKRKLENREEEQPQNEEGTPEDDGGYRYKSKRDTIIIIKPDTSKAIRISHPQAKGPIANAPQENTEATKPLYTLLMIN